MKTCNLCSLRAADVIVSKNNQAYCNSCIKYGQAMNRISYKDIVAEKKAKELESRKYWEAWVKLND